MSKETILTALDARIAEFDRHDPNFGTGLAPKSASGVTDCPKVSAALAPLAPLAPQKHDMEVAEKKFRTRACAHTHSRQKLSFDGAKCANGAKPAGILAKTVAPDPLSGAKLVPNLQKPSVSPSRAPAWNAREKVDCLMSRGLEGLEERDAAFMRSLARQQFITRRQEGWLDRIVEHVEGLSAGRWP